MNDRTFAIVCAIFSFLLSIIGSYILFRIQARNTQEENAYYKFYYAFYSMWNLIHQGRAFDYYDLGKEEQQIISNFLNENELYADAELRTLIYELTCSCLDNFNNNDKENIVSANKAYRQIVDIILKREDKLRNKYIKVHDCRIQKTDFTDPEKFVQD